MASKARRIFFWFRILILLTVAAAAGLIAYWSRTADPRFFLFLESPPGRVVSGWFGWDRWISAVGEGREPVLTAEEEGVRQKLEHDLVQNRPTHRVVLTDGVVLTGRVVKQTDSRIEFTETYGDSGGMTVQLRRDRIQRLEEFDDPVPAVSAQDVKFHLEFPELNFFRRPPYTIVSDESFFEVEGAVRELRRLHENFLLEFSGLLDNREERDHIQVVFLSDEDRFTRTRKRYAPALESSAGFYSPLMDRLIFFNQTRSLDMRKAGDRLRQEEAHYLARAREYGGEARVRSWAERHRRTLALVAEAETDRTVRHEGAHQLFYRYGVHSSIRLENTWLVEGLAGYCETERIGARDPFKISQLQEARTRGVLIPLQELLNSREPDGFFAWSDEFKIELGYAQSWALVDMLMQPKYRSGFFDYIRYVRDRDHLKELLKADRYELLARFTGIRDLDREFERTLIR